MISQRYKDDSLSILKLNKIQLESKDRVENYIKNGNYNFESICCSICGSTDSELLTEKDRYGLTCHVVICKICGLTYINPRMTQDSYNRFYDGEYRKLYIGVESPAKLYFYARYKKADKILNFIKSTNPALEFKSLNVLEIGCADGGILYYFKDQGHNVKGVDLGSEYLKFGRDNYNLDLIHGSLKDIPQDFTPDIIIYSHVLEHILNLDSELKQLKEKCTEKTLIYIEVPGIKNLHKIYKMDSLLYFQNAHTYHFSLTTLTNLFIKNGFRLIKGNEHVRSLFIKENSIKKTDYTNDYFDTLHYLIKMEGRRFIYPYKISTIKRKIVAFIKKYIILEMVERLHIKTKKERF